MARRPHTPSSDEPPPTRPVASDRSADICQAAAPRPSHLPGKPAVLDDLDAEAMARRKLLRLAAYSVPLVVGTLMIPQAAAASSICIPNENCSPNDPYCNPK
jgi:hypothetical protein